ncbi:hypothetical protein GPALN_012673 [Globodera pallida]|nr:hypothetical protein GPALN_012673 [Globodera pallida]
MEDYEQLDYDEEELKSALKKAQQIKKLGKEKPIAFLSDATKEARNSSSILASNVSSKCYINPNFTKRDSIRKAPSSGVFPIVPSNNAMCQYQYPLQSSYQQAKTHVFSLPRQSQNVPLMQPTSNFVSQMPWTTSHCSGGAAQVMSTASIPSNIYINPSVFNTPSTLFHSRQLQQQTTSQSGLNWDLMVDEFVKKTISVRTRRYAKSRSRSSSTGTSLSRHRRSRSVTRSSNSRPSSNASTPSPKKSRKKSNSPGRKDFKAKSSSQTKAQTKHSKQTIECAKAIGLGNEYLKQIEEQQKLRDEIARRKSQHRKEIYARDRDELKKNETSSTGAEGLQSKRDECERVRRQKLTTNKLRPYLAVVVTNLSGVEDFRKIALIAGKIGQVKKVWQENESNVYLIFEKHEDAKKFMQQYIGNSTVFGRVIDVSMKKVFLNTATFVQNSTDS